MHRNYFTSFCWKWAGNEVSFIKIYKLPWLKFCLDIWNLLLRAYMLKTDFMLLLLTKYVCPFWDFSLLKIFDTSSICSPLYYIILKRLLFHISFHLPGFLTHLTLSRSFYRHIFNYINKPGQCDTTHREHIVTKCSHVSCNSTQQQNIGRIVQRQWESLNS